MGPNAADYAGDDEAARATRVRERFTSAKAAMQRDFEAMHEDLLMLVGGENQWDPTAVAERRRIGRPMYTGNRFPAMLAQVTGEIRRNKPGIRCTPGDAAATKNDAKVYEGLIRAIERLSNAPSIYAKAGKSTAACGLGHMRIVPVREDDEGFDTGLRIRLIKNVYSVLWGPFLNPDRSDAPWCIVVSELDKKDFEDAYGAVASGAWETAQKSMRQMSGWRGAPNKITVAEEWNVLREPYERYRVVKARTGFVMGENGMPMWSDASGEETTIDGDIVKDGDAQRTIDGAPEEVFLQHMAQAGFDVVDRRTAYKKKICMYLWAGDKQIAGPIEWEGSRIPIFTVVGEEIDVGEETVTHGMIRHAKDAQRLFNYARSADLELVSQAPKAPLIVADEQIDGHEDVWALAQRQPVPYLPYNHVNGIGAPQERNGPGTNPGPSSLAQSGIIDMQDVVGVHDASLGKKSNETSGVAIEARDAQADTGTYVYLDNLNATIEAMGNELVAAIPAYYSAREQIMILGEDDAPEIIDLQQRGVRFGHGKYHVVCQRGPSYQTKREKAADWVVQTMKVAPPPAIPVLFDILVDLTDMPLTDEQRQMLTQSMVMAGMLPPPQGAMPPAMPGAQPGAMPPPMPGAPPPNNVIPMQPRGAPAPMPPADPLAGLSPVSPPRVPALRQRAGPPQGASPG